jgi:eukaryotic-like serine/threonine-protein kinase
MSPEQIRGERLDARTDIFSFGLVLYEMATGERAFTGETEAILHDAIQNRAPRAVRDLAPEITPSLEEVIGTCLEKEPSNRFRSTAELRDALERARFQVPLAATESTQKSKKAFPHRPKFAVTLLAVLAVIALVSVAYRSTHPRFKLTDKDTVVLGRF